MRPNVVVSDKHVINGYAHKTQLYVTCLLCAPKPTSLNKKQDVSVSHPLSIDSQADGLAYSGHSTPGKVRYHVSTDELKSETDASFTDSLQIL